MFNSDEIVKLQNALNVVESEKDNDNPYNYDVFSVLNDSGEEELANKISGCSNGEIRSIIENY